MLAERPTLVNCFTTGLIENGIVNLTYEMEYGAKTAKILNHPLARTLILILRKVVSIH
jgi:hypothetical protein